MTVKTIRKKEMGLELELKPVAQEPLGDPTQPEIPRPMEEQDGEVADHVHPEYDQLLVKIQELEQRLNEVQAPEQGDMDMGIEAADTAPEDEEEDAMAEELKGIPERPLGKDSTKIGPDATSEIPATAQPSNGVAPGDENNNHDKFADKPANDAASKVPKPSGEYSKPTVTKNSIKRKEMEEDPSKPKPGAEEKEPDKMEGSKPKSGTSGYESYDEIFNSLRAEIRREGRAEKFEERLVKRFSEKAPSRRESVVGASAVAMKERQNEYLDVKSRVSNTIKEYLQKAGHNGALANIGPGTA